MSRKTVSGSELAARLRERDVSVAPAVLNLLEDASRREEAQDLLVALGPGALGGEAPGHIVGVTGPPGVGKSTLLGALVAAWRGAGRTVAVLAVDPSSKRSGGALLGDRIRIAGPGVGGPGRFIRSMAARERVGGLAPATRAAAQVLAVAFDVVVVETVGVGQSETEVAELADTVAVVVQPGAEGRAPNHAAVLAAKGESMLVIPGPVRDWYCRPKSWKCSSERWIRRKLRPSISSGV